jgi:ABC-type uncharacterized transport system auxiliary subunit
VKLVSVRDNHVVAVKTFKAQAPVASTDPGVMTAALNGALFGLMAQTVVSSPRAYQREGVR